MEIEGGEVTVGMEGRGEEDGAGVGVRGFVGSGGTGIEQGWGAWREGGIIGGDVEEEAKGPSSVEGVIEEGREVGGGRSFSPMNNKTTF